ncbi:MAG: alanine racemase [Erysipelotrichaceae bacterium]
MLTSESRAWLEIDLNCLDKNIESIKTTLHNKTKIMAIVKANAYGAGDIVIAQRLQEQGIDFFGVSCIDEAINLRLAGIKEEILILGYTPIEHFHYLVEYNVIQTLVSYDYALKIETYCEMHNTSIRAHVKVDTGMQRIGIPALKEHYQIDEIIACYNLKKVDCIGMFSHFSVSDDVEHQENIDFTNQQVNQFICVIKDLKQQGIDPGTLHLQNSYGIINYPELEFDYVRPGILLLGLSQRDDTLLKYPIDLYPIMQLKANVSLVKDIMEHTSVSYGRNYRSNEKRRIATITIGYADGYPRFVSNKNARVLVHGQYAPIIGNICMDQMIIDVSDIEDVHEGDIVTLFGEDSGKVLTMDELSRKAETINNETACWIGARVPRIYKNK